MEEDQAKLGDSISQALEGSSPVREAADKIVSSGDWLHDLQPRCYAVVSVALSRALAGVLQAQSTQSECFFDASCTRKIQILLSVRLPICDRFHYSDRYANRVHRTRADL